jgi:hypothetical protein
MHPPPVGRRRAPPPAAAAAVLSVPAAPARSKRRCAQSHAPAAQAASDGDSDPPALESFSDNDSSSSDFGVNPPKYTHALYFSPGFAAAFFLFSFLSWPLARFNFAPASSCIFFLFSPGEQRRSKEKPKKRQPAAARRGGRSGGGDGSSGVWAQARRWDITGSVALDVARFYWGGQGGRCARACEAYLAQSETRRALPKGYESFELNILAVSTAGPPH